MAIPGAAHARQDDSAATCDQAISLPPRLLNQVRSHFYYVDHCPVDGRRIHMNGAGEPLAWKAAPLEADAPGYSAQAAVATHGWEDLETLLGASHGRLWRAPSVDECSARVLGLAQWEVDAYYVGSEALFCRPRQGFAWLCLAMRDGLAATSISTQLLRSPKAERLLAPFGYKAATRLSLSHYNSEEEVMACLQSLEPLLERPPKGKG